MSSLNIKIRGSNNEMNGIHNKNEQNENIYLNLNAHRKYKLVNYFWERKSIPISLKYEICKNVIYTNKDNLLTSYVHNSFMYYMIISEKA